MDMSSPDTIAEHVRSIQPDLKDQLLYATVMHLSETISDEQILAVVKILSPDMDVANTIMRENFHRIGAGIKRLAESGTVPGLKGMYELHSLRPGFGVLPSEPEPVDPAKLPRH